MLPLPKTNTLKIYYVQLPSLVTQIHYFKSAESGGFLEENLNIIFCVY